MPSSATIAARYTDGNVATHSTPNIGGYRPNFHVQVLTRPSGWRLRPFMVHLIAMHFRSLAVALSLLATVPFVHAEEGMWLFSAPPRAALKAAYDFDLTDAWLDHLMRSSVRFNSGGSGSFVSGDGLVITNHHVGADSLQKMGTPEHNYLRDGFY
ncbi:MAG TPA: S46 family peptidase, partial [Rariglobus sp.]